MIVLDHDETFQAYSSFTTNYKPAEQYESLLVQASTAKSQAVTAFQRREAMESSLVCACAFVASSNKLTL